MTRNKLHHMRPERDFWEGMPIHTQLLYAAAVGFGVMFVACVFVGA